MKNNSLAAAAPKRGGDANGRKNVEKADTG